MYDGDSFFTLAGPARLGLLALTGALSVAMLLLVWRICPRVARALRLPVAVALFWIFVWVSPQIYYAYYLVIFDGLPVQWVIWPPRWPAEALALLGFRGPDTLSAHGQGLLGWGMIAVAALRTVRT